MPTLADPPLAPSTTLDDTSLPRLLSNHDPSPPAARAEEPEPRRPNKTVLLLVAAPALAAACLYAGTRIAGVELLPSAPPGLPAEETSAVRVPGLGASRSASGDTRELRSLRAAATVALETRKATGSATAKGGGKRQEKEEQESPEPPPPGDGTDDSDPKLTLPIVGETPVSDPGLEAELPVNPEETLPATGVTVPDADLTPPDTGSILP